MSRSLSERQLRIGFGISISALALLGAGFYAAQNNAALPGGKISVIKLAWLGCAILFWYLLPALLLLDGRMPQKVRRVYIIFLVSMLVRGAVELFMMYVTGTWHPWMGITHNLVMLVLMAAFVTPLFRESASFYAVFLVVATAMFLPETGFALYMLGFATSVGHTVYFVPGEPEHYGIMFATAVCVALLIAYLIFFSRLWLHGQSERWLS